MKLYLTPSACSLADHIALRQAGRAFDGIRVDLRTKRTEDGSNCNEVNPKGYVPALVLDDGQLLTENVAILYWIAERAPQLVPGGTMGRIRLIEMLAFIATELHKPFVRAFFPTSDAEKQIAQDAVRKRLGFVADRMHGDYLFGREFSAADAHLYVMLRWGGRRSWIRPSRCRPSSTGGGAAGGAAGAAARRPGLTLAVCQIDPQHDPKAPAAGPDGGNRSCCR